MPDPTPQQNQAGTGTQNNQQGSGDGAAANQNNNTPAPEQNWDTFLQAQPENVRQLYETHTKGLRSALTSERDARADLEKQMRDLAKKAEKGSEMETQLTRFADDLSAANLKIGFYEEAAAKGLAYLDVAFNTAVAAGAIDQKGRVNWALLEERYPLIFKPQKPAPPKGDAGTGSGSGNNVPTKDMNAWIRRSTGHS